MDRLWKRVDVREPDDCWPWTGYRDETGHGRIRVDGKTRSVHRLVYGLAVGAIPSGLVIHHICEHPPCCNPRHLVAMTREAHNRLHLTRERCRYGHEYVVRRGEHVCLKCQAKAQREYQARRRAKVASP